LVILIPALPFCHAELRASKSNSVSYTKQINSLGDHIRTHRLDLKLLQKQVADQIGVDKATITNWERNSVAPAVRYLPTIIQFLGYDPLPPHSLSALLPRAENSACRSRKWPREWASIQAGSEAGKPGSISPPGGAWM
jgi:transcriptional regulator with XRE-family HTH domain